MSLEKGDICSDIYDHQRRQSRRNPSLQAENLIDCQRQELIAFLKEERVSAIVHENV